MDFFHSLFQKRLIYLFFNNCIKGWAYYGQKTARLEALCETLRLSDLYGEHLMMVTPGDKNAFQSFHGMIRITHPKIMIKKMVEGKVKGTIGIFI